IGGPEVLTYAEMLKQTGRLMGTGEPKIVPIPVLTPKLSAYWVSLMPDVPSSVARPLIHGLKTPVVADTATAQAQFAVELTPFADAVRLALSEPRSHEAAQAAATAGGAGG
ncbi:MAG: NADH-binding protein, partial [Haloarcula sp.]